MAPGSTRNRRLPPEERRAQIVQAVLEVVARYGVPGATISRIAAAADVSEGALYVHFANRDEMLMAALEAIFTDMAELIDSSAGGNAVERLKLIARNHSALMKTKLASFTSPWLEFIAAGPQVGLRDAVARTQTRAFDKLLGIIEFGQTEGTIRKDLDAKRITWQWYTIMWAENVSSLMGLTEYIDDGHSGYSLDLLLRDAATGAGAAPQPGASGQ